MTSNLNPLISIITVVYNGEKFIESTIKSVISQNYKNIEYIIIDGASTDGTIEVIKKYENDISYWISEKDNGISDAFNKGIKRATGDLIGIINADDFYNDNILELVAKNYDRSIDIYFGSIIKLNEDSSVRRFESSKNALQSVDSCNMRFIYHPTFFMTSELYEKYGYFDLNYKLAMDYEFLSRINFNKIKSKYIRDFICTMRTNGVSDIFNYKAKLEVINAYRIRNNVVIDKNIVLAYYGSLKSYIRYKITNFKIGRKIVEIKRYISK